MCVAGRQPEDAVVPLPSSTLPAPARPRRAGATLAAPRRPAAGLQPGPVLAFVLFIVANAILLIRPAEILPQLEGIELYFYAIAACALVASGDVLKYVTSTPLDTQPI